MTDLTSTPAVDAPEPAPEVTDSPATEVTTTPAAETTEQQTPQTTDQPASESEVSMESVDDIVEWSQKRGTPIDPNNENEVRLAKSLRDTQRDFHESRQDKTTIGEVIDKNSTGDELQDELAEIRVERYFRRNPAHEQYRDKMTEIANREYTEDPDLAYKLVNKPDLLYKMALAEGLDKATDQAAQKAAQETREQLARTSQTTTARPAATTGAGASDKPQYTKAQFDALSPEQYEKIRGTDYEVV